MDISWVKLDDTIMISSNGLPIPRHAASKIPTNLAKKSLLNNFLRKPDQGKAYKLTAQHPASNHFLRDGKYTAFADWRFIHRARLSVVPLHGLRRFGNLSSKCCRCGYPKETLAHVLNHCRKNLHLAIKRHNAVLRRLYRAVNDPNITIRCNQCVPGFEDNCRPDLVAINEVTKSATIIDVAIPFENGDDAFNQVRPLKTSKYAALTQFHRSQGYDTFCDALVVGSLGGYDPSNIAVLQRLGIERNYSKTMAKLMVSNSIRWSRYIYLRHLGFEPRAAHQFLDHRSHPADSQDTRRNCN
ncbi:uncharacterized protein [Centruroides vittatus]